MKENNWYTFSEGSKKLGKSHSYLYKSMKDRPELFKSTMIQKQGRIWLISDEGLNYIKKNTKKEGVLVSNKRAFEDKYLILLLLDKALNNYFTFFKNLSLLLIYSRVTLKVGR